jgi:hypothetical protein
MAFAVDQSTSGLEESLLRVRINEHLRAYKV